MLPPNLVNELKTTGAIVIYGGGATDLRPPFIILSDFTEEIQDTISCYPYNRSSLQIDCYDYTLDKVDFLRNQIITILQKFSANSIRVNYFYEAVRKLHRRSIECFIFADV